MSEHPVADSTVILFSSLLLPSSQTFVKAQGEELRRFQPYYVGSRLVKGLELPPDRTITVNQGGALGNLEEVAFKLTGLSPRLYQRVQQLKPVLLHAQFGLSGALALPLVRSLHLPLLVHYRGADATLHDDHIRYTSLNHWIYLRRRESLKRESRLFLTVSQFIKDTLLEQGFPSDKVRVHYSGINVAAFQPDRDRPRQPVVLFVGRLTEKKGCQYLIQAMAQVQAILPEVELVVIGDGDLRSELEAQAANQLKRYRFLGMQPQPVVIEWMNSARLLAAPSITAANGDSEGLPNVVLEAQAMGLPVVSTIHAGIPEAVLHGETGFLAPERNAETLAESILQLLQDTDLWQCFSVKGRERVQFHFDRRKQTQILEGIYDAIVNGEL